MLVVGIANRHNWCVLTGARRKLSVGGVRNISGAMTTVPFPDGGVNLVNCAITQNRVGIHI